MTVKISSRIVVFLAMLFAAWLSYALTPTVRMAKDASSLDLASVVPDSFGEWSIDPNVTQLIIDPRVRETIDLIYTDTLTRTYVDSKGNRIMLSIAYGADQGRANQVHKPEVCYPAQGFVINDLKKAELQLQGWSLPVMQMVAVQSHRTEPVTYWIVVGDEVVRGSVEQNLARLQYGFRGLIPDGLLFRVSSIQNDSRQAYELQKQFIRDLINALPSVARSRFIGKHALHQR